MQVRAPLRHKVVESLDLVLDQQSADGARGRIDCKCLLDLELTDLGFDYTLLHEFRNRLLENKAEHELLDDLLKLLRGRKLLTARGKQPADSTHVLATIRRLNRPLTGIDQFPLEQISPGEHQPIRAPSRVLPLGFCRQPRPAAFAVHDGISPSDILTRKFIARPKIDLY